MSENTKIEWADHTFNPWEGCQKVGPGCDHCYAEARNSRFNGGKPINWGPGAPRRLTSEGNWRLPLKWNAQAEREGRRFRVFCASLADVFDNEAPYLWRVDLFRLIADTPHLDWLLLTKRIANARDMIEEAVDDNSLPAWPWPNVWIGATVVNQEEVDRDIPKLLRVPARLHFLSIEPMLGPISLRRFMGQGFGPAPMWVIAGGESGPKARPSHPDWFRSLRDQCAAVRVPFLFKQHGEWLSVSQMDNEFMSHLYKPNRVAKPHEDQGSLNDCYGRRCLVPQAVIQADGTVVEALSPMAFRQGLGSMLTFKVGKKAAGRLLDGVEHNGFPEAVCP
jgi:protein gp37